MGSSTLEARSRRPAIVRCLPALLVFSAALSHAQAPLRHHVNIESQPVGAALRALAAQTGLQVLVFSTDVANKLSPAVAGHLTTEEAIIEILDDSGLTYRKIDDNTVAVGKQAAAAESRLHSTSYHASPRPFRLAQSDASQSQDAAQPAADAEPAAEAPVIQEVLVTARKVTERLQDVPASILALDPQALENSGATSLQDIGRQVPGLNVVSAGPGQNQLIIRGLSSTGGGSMVGYYIDDTPVVASTNINQTSAVDPALFDLARVEVLRGPQGTLYGAASMGGTVKYVTQQPELTEFSGLTKLTTSVTEQGGFNSEVGTVVNLPLVQDVAAVRIAAFYRDNDGYLDRHNTDPADYLAVLPGGPASRDVNSERTYGGRIAVKLQPFEGLTITPAVLFQRMKLGGSASFDAPAGSFDHPIQNRLFGEPVVDQLELYSLNIQGDVGPVSMTSSTSYFNRDNRFTEDESKITYFLFPQVQTRVYPTPFNLNYPNHNFTEELRAAFEIPRGTGVVGVFYQRVGGFAQYDWVLPEGYNAAFGDPFPGETSVYIGTDALKDIQKAAFGEINVDITSKLTATLGGRAFKQEQTHHIYASGVLNGGTSTNDVSTEASGFTPKYGLSYQFTDDAMAYLSASKGFRGGGAFTPIPDACNADLAALGLNSPPTEFKPDTLWNYELGAKTQWLDRRLTLNGDLYYIEWEKLQQRVNLACAFYFVGNFGTATSQGAELELQYEPVPAIRLGLAVAFNEAELTSTVTGTDGVAGQTLPNAPKWTGSASAEYHRDIGSRTTLVGRLDFNSSTQSYSTFNTSAYHFSRAGYSLMNARLTATVGAWDVSLFATNLLNKHAETAAPSSYGSILPTQAQIAIERPRTVGVDVKVSY